MKPTLFTLALALTTSSVNLAFAQGALNFANFGGGVNAPVSDAYGNKLNGPGFLADLYWAPGNVSDSSQLVCLCQPATFRTSGYFFGGERTIPGQDGGTTITAQVRVWDVAHGSSWVQAVSAGGALTAESQLFRVTLTSTPSPPASLIGLQPFTQPICLSCPQPWPVLVTVSSTPNGLLLSWPDYLGAGRYKVQENPDPNATHWSTRPEEPMLVALPPNGEPQFQILLPQPARNMFYRLVWQ